MTRFTRSDDLRGAEFADVDLTGARFVGADLSRAVLRGVDVQHVEIESPWLLEGGNALHVNGVDVVPLIDAELDRRFPGRELRHAADPAGLRAAWVALETAWQAALDRVAAMPDGTTDAVVDGEWSFAQTLRHLVMATDVWLLGAILGQDRPYHPLGQPFAGAEEYGIDPAFFAAAPPYADVLEVRAGHQAMVREFLATVTPDELAVPRRSPWNPEGTETTLSCLHTILDEEWEHLRYALRDLDTLDRQRA